ncbi:hypothetical protein [Actinoplanes missouriensis]|nr:hypothetical protein [Actinoplanes missouriensis]
MTDLRYAAARPILLANLEPGDQVHSPYGYRVVHDITEDVNGDIIIYFWDEEPIRRIPGATVQAMKRIH